FLSGGPAPVAAGGRVRSGAEHRRIHRPRTWRRCEIMQPPRGRQHIYRNVAGWDVKGSRILIVEDEPPLLRGLKDSFAIRGCDVLTAADGEAGLQLALSESPDLILLDIMLPKVNGYEICRLLRENGLDMPIIMLTAKGQEEDVILGLNLG